MNNFCSCQSVSTSEHLHTFCIRFGSHPRLENKIFHRLDIQTENWNNSENSSLTGVFAKLWRLHKLPRKFSYIGASTTRNRFRLRKLSWPQRYSQVNYSYDWNICEMIIGIWCSIYNIHGLGHIYSNRSKQKGKHLQYHKTNLEIWINLPQEMIKQDKKKLTCRKWSFLLMRNIFFHQIYPKLDECPSWWEKNHLFDWNYFPESDSLWENCRCFYSIRTFAITIP